MMLQDAGCRILAGSRREQGGGRGEGKRESRRETRLERGEAAWFWVQGVGCLVLGGRREEGTGLCRWSVAPCKRRSPVFASGRPAFCPSRRTGMRTLLCAGTLIAPEGCQSKLQAREARE